MNYVVLLSRCQKQVNFLAIYIDFLCSAMATSEAIFLPNHWAPKRIYYITNGGKERR